MTGRVDVDALAFRAGQAVLDAKRVLHVARGGGDETRCGVRAVAVDLHWQTVTRMICTDCASDVMDGVA